MIIWENNFIHKYNVEIDGSIYKLEFKTCEINEDTIEELQSEFDYAMYEDYTGEIEPIEMGKDFIALFADGYLEHYVVGEGDNLFGKVIEFFILDRGGKGNPRMSVEEIFKLNNWEYTYEKC